MTKRMLIDDTQPEETRVVVVNGNKLEDVEFESTTRRQIKGNIYLGKIMRVEPSLQACFIDYGGNRHGFMAFSEIHPDYYNVSDEVLAEVDKEVDEIIENKKRIAKEIEAQREARAKERALAREAALREREERAAAEVAAQEQSEDTTAEVNAVVPQYEDVEEKEGLSPEELKICEEQFIAEEEAKEEEQGKKRTKKRLLKKRFRKQISSNTEDEDKNDKVLAEDIEEEDAKVVDDCESNLNNEEDEPAYNHTEDDENDDDDDDEDDNNVESEDDDESDDFDGNVDFELQRKLIRARKLYHRFKIQDVIKEGQTVLVQVVKEERGNKGAAMTTYLSLAGRYCVLMPNRIKSGGVSRKITNAADRQRLKGIVRDLPLNPDMSIIVRTAGEEKTKAEIVRDYNFLIRAWNQIRIDAIKNKAPLLVHEEGSLIKRALRDIYTKDIAEILVAGDEAYKQARNFLKILSPSNLKKIKHYSNNDAPLFQKFQVEGQLDKLHDANAQLESGGYLVINPTEALVSIDVNSGRATKEKDLEETALKTNLEACDEIARQLKLRNLAGLVVIDFIDMDEPANNHAVEKRMKEALKNDRSRIQVGKMSMFGLLELSRQRVHSAFWESNYQVCPYCHGRGITRTMESAAMYILRTLEEEGCKNRSSKVNISVPSDVAVYLLNYKRKALSEIETKYKMDVIICADNNVKCVTDYKIERTKICVKEEKVNTPLPPVIAEEAETSEEKIIEETSQPAEEINNEENENIEIADELETEPEIRSNYRERRGRFDRRGRRGRFDRRGNRHRNNYNDEQRTEKPKASQEPVILYDSHESAAPIQEETPKEEKKEKSNWWKKLIKG